MRPVGSASVLVLYSHGSGNAYFTDPGPRWKSQMVSYSRSSCVT